uniref:Bifunctional dihydrofolate reductase-thymidylate synthase n=1 Tax=Marseillevirus LCMAC101 TaxID=2506602 RepID=A0A481YQS6_9VIRU|nr:MAG: bifunctional dihydrofolate reductase-thymidylate synthase [Marseillevirus LCMAC101]
MSLSRFSIIVAIDSGNGMAKNGGIPWGSKSDQRYFRETTHGRGKNAVIMGRITYESIPTQFRPLQGRHCVVVSRSWRQEEHPDIIVCPSLLDALSILGGSVKAYEEVFVAGGEHIYNEAVRDYLYLCDRIHVNKFKTDYDCDQHFPWDEIKDFPILKDVQRTRDFQRYVFLSKIEHPEYQYLKLIQDIAENGDPKPDRTGIGTRSKFGVKMEFDISERIPILTTKKVNYEAIVKELLFFISGNTNTNILKEQGVKIWTANTSKDFLLNVGLDYDEGDMGPLYGFQWRHWGAEYEGMDKDYTGKGIDQLSNLINNIRKDPHSRRHLLSCWNVSQLKEMCLNPCHFTCQFNVSGDRRHLDCQLYQRSGDMFLGVPYNIACYSMLTCMIAQITGLRPRKFTHIIGDAHVYNSHQDQVKKQLNRTPRPFPRLSFRGATRIHEIDDFDFKSFIIEGYTSWPHITAPMAV